MSYGGNGRNGNGGMTVAESLPMGAGVSGELLERPTFVESQIRGEVDMQVATAKKYPRSLGDFKKRALALATLDEDTASGCFYTLPARKGGDGKPIEGPSVRLAEIVASSWGNMRAEVMIVDDDGESITALGRCIDLETNVAISMPVRRRIIDKYGKRYSPDMINTTSNAACSIALRNAVFKVVPLAVVKPIYDAARKVAIGDATTLVKRRADMIAYFKKMGVQEDRVFQAVEKNDIDDIGLPELAILKGIATAIKDGETSVDEAFPPIPKPGEKKPDEKPKTATDKLAESIGANGKTETSGATPTSAPITRKALEERIASATRHSELHEINDLAKEHLTPEEFELIGRLCHEAGEAIDQLRNAAK